MPKGSILGHILINDIVNDIGYPIRLFADDTSLYIVVDSPISAANFLNSSLRPISNLAAAWLVDFNTNKTVSMTISRKANPPQHPPLFMDNIILTDTDIHKLLGITFSASCTWSNHIHSIRITRKAMTRLNLMRTLKFKVSRTALERIYISFIRPLLEYSDSVWNNCSNEAKKEPKLHSIHI